MKIKNLTNSPYELPNKDGTTTIIPAFGVAEVDLQEGYNLNETFFEADTEEDVTVTEGEEVPAEEETNEDEETEGDEEGAEGDEEEAEKEEEEKPASTSGRKRRNRRR